MRDETPIGAAYAAMHARHIRSERRKSLSLIAAALALAVMFSILMHLFNTLAARVSADMARAAVEFCGAC